MGQAPEREDTRRGRGKFDEAGNYTFHFVLLFSPASLQKALLNARLHPRLKSWCPSCASRTNEGQREGILLERNDEKIDERREYFRGVEQR